MSKRLLEVKDLKVVYKTDEGVAEAINNINFHVDAGETLGLVGETGAGKTTTALSITRLLPERTGHILSGDIIFDGINLLEVPEKEMAADIRGKKISMIFQDPMTALNPVMKIGDQIAEVLKYHDVYENVSEEELNKHVDQTLELVGLPPSRKNEYPHQFSGGMKQRVVIAIALACTPSLLIADEPTTALDVTIQAQVIAMMTELKEKLNMSMIMITHDLGIVAQTCDRVCVMYAGEIIESGLVEDIFESSNHHPYTDGLFGSIPRLNFQAKRLSPIPGLMPDSMNLPPGCKFHKRCPKVMPICKEVLPPSIQISETHSIACHLFDTQEEKEVSYD